MVTPADEANNDDASSSVASASKASSAASPAPINRDSNTLCSSCDSCRTRKTKCNGLRPCHACIIKHVKKNKLSNTEGITAEDCGCSYSAAKRRGPQPGFRLREAIDGKLSSKKRGTKDGKLHSPKKKKRKEKRGDGQEWRNDGMMTNYDMNMGNQFQQIMGNQQMGNGGIFSGGNIPLPLDPGAAALQQQILSGLGAIGLGLCANLGGMSGFNPNQGSRGQDAMAAASSSSSGLLSSIQQLQQQNQEFQRQQQQQAFHFQEQQQQHMNSFGQDPTFSNQMSSNDDPPGSLPRRDSVYQISNSTKVSVVGCEKTSVLELTHLLEPNHPLGSRFRACYALSFGSMFQLPPVLTFEEYSQKFTPPVALSIIPKYDVAALQATQFAMLAIGALTDGERSMVHELINASILCLQDSVKEPVHISCQFELAKAFFFHSLLRCYDGEMERCFKYRRAAMNTLAKLDGYSKVETLIAAISFQDTLLYTLYNGCDSNVPEIDSEYPQVPATPCKSLRDESFAVSSFVSDPKNKMWINGPSMFSTNISANSFCRVLDILSCATRSFVDESQSKKESDVYDTAVSSIAEDKMVKYKNCLNYLDEASKLLEGRILQERNDKTSSYIDGGLHLLFTALQVTTNEGTSETLESQAHNAFHVLKAVIAQPNLLNQGGATYFLAHKCVLFTARLINKFHEEGLGDDESRALYDEAIDLYHASRVVINIHSCKLPDEIRMHKFPRPEPTAGKEKGPMIKLDRVTQPRRMSHLAKKLSTSASDIEKQCHINDRAFLVFLSGLYLASCHDVDI